ncbi:MAG: GNAT family N-acetyltransferase [Rhodospirillales bacterium]|nr:GNAT family N-acetyltransferase [Rhodospirillales bacterium]MDE2197747.1 GNAT family N-acetyltransferase [Rhodospirillales bacterium]
MSAGLTTLRPELPLLRPLRQSDLAAARRLSAAVDWPHRLEDWRVMRQLGDGVAATTEAGVLIGTALWWEFGSTASSLGMVLVRADWQGRGVGRALMQAGLRHIGPRGLMLNATDAGLALYRKLGFRPVGVVAQHQGVLRAPPPSRAETRRAQPADHAALIALDAQAFGAPRASALAQLFRDGVCHLVEKAGQITGFAIRRRFGLGQAVGPVVAANERDAISLIGACLATGFLRIDIADEWAELAGWLNGAGLSRVGTVTTMIRGDWPARGGAAHRFALVNQGIG